MKRASILVALLSLCFVSTMWAQVAPTRTVSGTRIGHYKDGGVPTDLSTRTIAAFVPGRSGGYTQIVGTGTSSGTFSIPNVPYGYYLLQLGGRYLWTKNTVVSFDYNASYRSTQTVAGGNTTLTFGLTNLNPWQTTDFLELVDPSTSAFVLYPGADGQTTFAGTFPYTNYLNDSTLGDKTYFLQLATQSVGGYPFLSAARYLSPSFAQVDGADTTVAGPMKAINQTQAFRANINGADIAAVALAANPNSTLTTTVIALDVYPGNMAKGDTTATPDLVGYDFNSDVAPLTVNADLGDVMYGNPFPPSFRLFSVYQYSAQTSYLLPGTTNPTALATWAVGTTPELPTAEAPMRPMVGVVSQPMVSGGDFFANRNGIGYLPTLTWGPPQVGSANVYSVAVYWIINNAGNTQANLIARLLTQNTSITLPPGIMSAGQTYVFQITSGYRPGVDVAAHPYFLGPINAGADAISGMMQP